MWAGILSSVLKLLLRCSVSRPLWLLKGSASAAYQASALRRNAWVPSDFFQLCSVAWPSSNTGAGTGWGSRQHWDPVEPPQPGGQGRVSWQTWEALLWDCFPAGFDIWPLSLSWHILPAQWSTFHNFLKTVMLIYYMKGTPQKVVTFGGLLLFLLATPRGSKLLVSGDMSERKVKVAQSCLTCRWILYQLNHKGSPKEFQLSEYKPEAETFQLTSVLCPETREQQQKKKSASFFFFFCGMRRKDITQTSHRWLNNFSATYYCWISLIGHQIFPPKSRASGITQC